MIKFEGFGTHVFTQAKNFEGFICVKCGIWVQEDNKDKILHINRSCYVFKNSDKEMANKSCDFFLKNMKVYESRVPEHNHEWEFGYPKVIKRCSKCKVLLAFNHLGGTWWYATYKDPYTFGKFKYSVTDCNDIMMQKALR